MGRASWAWCALACACLFGCGKAVAPDPGEASPPPDTAQGPRTGSDAPGGPQTPPAHPPAQQLPPQQPAKCDGTASVFVRGARPGLVSSFQLAIGSASVDLVAGDAFRVGSVTLPARGPATATLALGAGRVVGGELGGPVAACAAPLAFTFDPTDVDPVRCRVVVELDLGRSLVRDPATGALLLVPQSTLHF